MARKYIVSLTAEERVELEKMISSGQENHKITPLERVSKVG
jgi:hypothetical protein